MPRLLDKYTAEVVPAMKRDYAYTNVMEIPRITKVSVNMGLGEAVQNPKIIDVSLEELKQITGQKPVITRSKKAIAGFKLRAGLPIGVSVTLRSARMYEFLDRLMSIALPRVRDFRGVSPKGFDGRGNFTLGLREQIIFPEINYDKVEKVKGMNITVVTTAQTDDEARKLLTYFGMPFRK